MLSPQSKIVYTRGICEKKFEKCVLGWAPFAARYEYHAVAAAEDTRAEGHIIIKWSQPICTHTVYLTFRDQSNSGTTLGAENIWTGPGTHGADNYAADSAAVLISKRLRARGRAPARVETRSPLTCDCQKSRAHAHLPPAAATVPRILLLSCYSLL